jgi:hypothetical protein
MSPRIIVGLALKASIMLTLFGFGLQATREDLLYLLRRPRVLVRSLVEQTRHRLQAMSEDNFDSLGDQLIERHDRQQ